MPLRLVLVLLLMPFCVGKCGGFHGAALPERLNERYSPAVTKAYPLALQYRCQLERLIRLDVKPAHQGAKELPTASRSPDDSTPAHAIPQLPASPTSVFGLTPRLN